MHRILMALLALSLGACHEAVTDPSDTSAILSDIPTTFPDNLVVTDTILDTTPVDTSALTRSKEFDWSIPTNAPLRATACPPPDTAVYGPIQPWKGFIHKGTTYTCNTCPGGSDSMQGEWRAVFDVDDPEAPYEKDPTYREYLKFDGNTFINVLEGQDLGQPTKATIHGWFFCSVKPETGNNAKFFVLTHVEPEGAFAWKTGMVFTGDILKNGKNEMLWGWYDSVVTNPGSPWGGTAPYCRVGSEIKGIICANPF